MKCPVCLTVALTMSERQGIEIDYCPQCRGVWLDRGELDKIIERAQAPMGVAPVATQAPYSQPPVDYGQQVDYRDSSQRGRDWDDDDHRYGDKRGHSQDPRKRKRGSFLEDIFDFG